MYPLFGLTIILWNQRLGFPLRSNSWPLIKRNIYIWFNCSEVSSWPSQAFLSVFQRISKCRQCRHCFALKEERQHRSLIKMAVVVFCWSFHRWAFSSSLLLFFSLFFFVVVIIIIVVVVVVSISNRELGDRNRGLSNLAVQSCRLFGSGPFPCGF